MGHLSSFLFENFTRAANQIFWAKAQSFRLFLRGPQGPLFHLRFGTALRAGGRAA